MTDLPLADFLRGNVFPGTADVPYPRADPSAAAKLPADTWSAAIVPAGVRLEIEGDATGFEIDYTLGTDDLGYRGVGAGTTFSLWQGDDLLDVADARERESVTLLASGSSPDRRLCIHLPEGLKPRITGLRAFGGEARPAPPGPRWLAYGDSITEGWVASAPGLDWAAIVARRHEIDLVNLGYAGAARGELASAEQIAGLRADAISIFYGTNCWGRTPFSADTMRTGFEDFVRIIRQAHPNTPLVIVSMITRPDAERTPNEYGATMEDLRAAIEDWVAGSNDPHLTLLKGERLVASHELADGIHPDDSGHHSLASAIGGAIVHALNN